MTLAAISRVPYFEYAQKGANCAQKGASEAYRFFKFAVADISRLVSKIDGADPALRAFEEAIKFLNLSRKAGEYASPMLDKILAIRSGIRVINIAKSLEYIVSAKGLYRDYIEQKYLSLGTQALLLLARVNACVKFFVGLGMGSWESLAKTAAKYGGLPAYKIVTTYAKTGFVNGLWLTALSGLLYNEVNAIRSGAEKRDVHWCNAVALSLDVAALGLSLLGIQNQALLLTLGFVAASTSVYGYFADPENTVTQGYN